MKNRKPNRLKDYDYSQEGCYYVTICTEDKTNYFGSVADEKMILNKYGNIAHENWLKILEHFEDVSLDEFIVMPNHVHGIIVIVNEDNAGNAYMHSLPNTSRTKMLLSRIIQQYKSSVSRNIRKIYHLKTFSWQKSFYDHIIRDEKDLSNIREYIYHNALKWELDKENKFAENALMRSLKRKM